MDVLITGSSGLIGSALVASLTEDGHDVKRLVRTATDGGDARWNPDDDSIDLSRLDALDAVVHLAGEPIAEGRWTSAKKARIRQSRVAATRLLAGELAKRDPKPRVIVSASAIGYYGDRGEASVDESSESGDGFLADVCRQWEQAMTVAVEAGIRVVFVRFGVVLSAAGGALKKMLLPFKLGIGGVVGNGRQYMSWVAIDDAVGAIQHILANETVTGPVNVVAPNPVTNRQFTKILGAVLRRPTLLPMPGFAARMAFGPMADELLLASTRVEPAQLEKSGYVFQYPQVEEALRHLVGH